MQIVLRPEVEQEIVEATDWYEARGQGLGAAFLRASEVAMAAALRAPLQFPTVFATYRRVLLRRFPYVLIFRIEGDALVVTACVHCRRDPEGWRSRI